MSLLIVAKGITKLSQLQIDTDKDWGGKGIANIRRIAEGMAKGHVIQHNGLILESLPPGLANYVLTSAGSGQKVVWAPGGTFFNRFYPIVISLAKSAAVFNPPKSKGLSAPIVAALGYADGIHPAWFRTQRPDITLMNSVIGAYSAQKTASKNAAVSISRTVELPIGGAIADDGGVQTDETAAAKSQPGINQSYTTGDDAAKNIGGTYVEAQTFTMSTTHAIRFVRLKLYRSGLPGNFTVSIKATDGPGHPTGVDLCSAIINGNDMTADSNGAWYRIDFGSPITLNSGTKYALVLLCNSSSVYWRCDTAASAFAGGNREYSTNGGTTWNTDANADFMFEEYGSTSDMTLFPTSIALNDAYYLGSPYKFTVAQIDVGQAGAGTYTVVWEYSRAGDYSACVGLNDGINGFRNQWTREVSHTPQADWAQLNILGKNIYWLRCRCTDAGTGYTQPLGTFVKVKIAV
jgi:hypothetical protein